MAIGISVRFRVTACSFLLLFISLLLTAYSARNPQVGAIGRVVLTEASAPVFSLVEWVRRSVGSSWHTYVSLVGAKAESEELRQRVQALEGAHVTAEELRLENVRLRELLELSQNVEVKGVAASVVGSTPTGWVNGIIINKGSLHGVYVGMAVMSAEGIVGQVVASAPHASHVLLLTDHSSGVDAILQHGRVRGVVEGAGSNKAALQYVNREEEVRVGDVVVTSGMDRVYPKGLVIGTVAAILDNSGTLFKEVSILPAVDFAKLEEVLVITSVPSEPANDWLVTTPQQTRSYGSAADDSKKR